MDMNINLDNCVETFSMKHYRVRELVSFIKAGDLWVLEYLVEAHLKEMPWLSFKEAQVQCAWLCRRS
jgi:hypothetical protein